MATMILVDGLKYVRGRYETGAKTGRNVFVRVRKDGREEIQVTNGMPLTGSEVYGQASKSEARKLRKAVRRAGFARLAGEQRYGG